MAPPDEKPRWWRENERDRAALDLPAYEPPRFADGTFVHAVVEELEAALDRRIQLLGRNPVWGDDWEVRVDGEVVFTVSRSRDDAGNTHYGLTAEAFEHRIRAATSAD